MFKKYFIDEITRVFLTMYDYSGVFYECIVLQRKKEKKKPNVTRFQLKSLGLIICIDLSQVIYYIT